MSDTANRKRGIHEAPRDAVAEPKHRKAKVDMVVPSSKGTKKSDIGGSSGSAKAVGGDDIDALFAGLKDKKVKAKEEAREKVVNKKKEEEKAALVEEKLKDLEREGLKKNRIKGPDSPIPLRVDPDSGYPVYTIDQLKIGRGGGTADCPFDCDCCF